MRGRESWKSLRSGQIYNYMEKRKVSRRTIIIIIIIVLIILSVAAFFIFSSSSFGFYNLPDFSAGSKLYDSLAKIFGGNSFQNLRLNPFENTTNG